MQMSKALIAALIAVSPTAAFAQSNSYPAGTDCSKLSETERTACEQQMNTMDPNTKPNNASGDGADPSDPNTDTNSSNIQPDANGATNSGQTN